MRRIRASSGSPTRSSPSIGRTGSFTWCCSTRQPEARPSSISRTRVSELRGHNGMAKQAGRLAGAALMAMVLTGCGITPSTLIAEEPVLDLRTTMLDVLQKLPPPAQPLVVAVYDFPDQTGQYKPSESV